MTTINLEALEAVLGDYPVTGTSGKPRTQNQLKKAFERIENPKHWKNSIDCSVIVENDEERELLRDAIIHFHGTVPMFSPIYTENGRTLYKVRNSGYCG